MDATRFDTWTRARAAATNRRAILGWSLAAGTAAIGLIRPTLAQAGGTCTYTVTLVSSTTAGATISGTLAIDIGTDGAIDTGSLTLQGQAAASVVGQVQGPAIELLAALADGSLLSLVGVSKADVSTCSDQVFGSLANADTHQLGTWLATPGSSASGSVPAQPQPPPSAPTSTPTPASEPASSSCDPPRMICGTNCCPAGADCLDTGACECPSGTEECGIACFPSCADGVSTLDPGTCLCPTG